ncbi:enolase-phosphatase E1-like [Durio zibethinus]|uniref:Enolase-phosphatase E1-like n=1 Tax=Durio zibethinus TaxID=66656 RepID=A0A6P5ZCF9_DURZI|nr:enolase-phosphatase E1-like [Durio zibethinus]
MATEAEIIPEHISLVKPEEESKHLTLELCDKVVKFLPGDLNKFQGELTRPAETGECLAKAENMPVASNNGVETMHTVSEGNQEISKGESFLISPEISKVANETRGMLEHTEVDDTPFKAEKTLEDEEKMVNDKKFQLEEEAGTGENEVKEATEDGMEKGGTDHGIEELNLDIGGEKRMEVEVIVDQDSSLEEKGESIEEETSHSQESEHKGTMTDENADNIESDEQVLGIQQANLELKKQALIHTPDPTIESLKEANETVTEASNSNLQEELEEKSFKEVKDTESEKLPALVGKEEGTEVAILGREKDQITSDSIGDTLTSTLAESSEIKDHETTSEISEVAKKEPCNPYEEVACGHESTPKVDDKLEEVSSIIIKQEGIQKELEDCTAEKPELEAMENISKQEETKELCEGPKSIIKEECAIIDETMKSTEEMHRSFQEEVKNETPQVEVPEKLEINTVEDAEKQILEEEDTNKHQTTLLAETIEEKPKEENTSPMMSIKKKKEDDSKAESNFEVSTSATDKEESLEKENEKREPEKELCKESETAASGTGKENPEMEEHPIADISNSSMSSETVKESIKDGQSSPMKLIEEASNSNIKETALQNLEETAEPNNDPSVLDIENESKEEITATEPKEDLVRRFSSELEESKKDTEEETSVKGIINTADLDSESPEAETKETNKKEAEAEEKKKERNNVLAAEENCMVTTEHEGIGIDGADVDVKPVDPSTSFEKEKEIPQVDGMQDKVPNAGSEDQMEMTTREIPLNEILGDEVKEYSTMPSEEHKLTPTVERKIIDETSEKDQTPDEHSESPVLQATDEILMVKEDNPTLDVPKAESEDTGKEGRHEVKEHLAKEPYVHTEQESGKSHSISGVTNVSNGEEPRELENESDACKEKTLQDKQSSDTGLERKKVEDGKPLHEATDVGKTSGTCHDSDKANREEENLANNLAKPESLEGDTEVEKEETELPGGAHDQIPEVINVNDNAKNVEPVVEDQSKETIPQPSKSQDDETSTDVQNQETEKQILEELEDKRDNEHYVNREQNANEVTKAVLLSEEVNKEVEKADDSEDIKQHVIDEESSTNELHLESKGDDTTNEVEEYASVSTVCLKEVDSNRQIEKSKSEVEEHLTKDREASVVIKESEEMRQDEESGDRVSMQGEEKESEEKIDDIVDGSKLCQDKSDIEAVTKVRAETSLNNTEVDKKLVSTSNISSETTESDANLETKELKLEEISSDLAPSVPTNDNDEVERQSLNVDIVDKDEAEVIKKDPDAVYLSEDQIDEAEKSLTVEKVDQLSNNDLELVETKSEASKTSNADELGKIELTSDGGHFSEDNGFEQDAETKKSLTAEELEANEVEESKGEPETSSNYLPQKVETILEEDAISSHNTLTEEKLEEQLQTSTSTLPSEDEEIKLQTQLQR